MNHVLLDTNTWIYLANGTEPSKLLNFLLEENSNGNIEILVPQIIIEEWDRNKDMHVKQGAIQHFKKLIEDFDRITKLLGTKGEPDVFHFLSDVKEKDYFVDFIEKFKGRQKEVEEAVTENIRTIDALFRSDKIQLLQVNDRITLRAAKSAIEKKAPFLKKNSFADAIIVFTFLEYVELKGIEGAMFISYNTEDFCEKKDGKKKLHPDLAVDFEAGKSLYFHIVGEALQNIKEDIITAEELEQIRLAQLEEEKEGIIERCVVCEENERFNPVYFGEIDLSDERKKNISLDPEQGVLELGGEFKANSVDSSLLAINNGRCSYCNTEHFICYKCGAVNAVLDHEFDERKACEGCGLEYIVYSDDDDGSFIGATYVLPQQLIECRECGNEFEEDEFSNDDQICSKCIEELNNR